MGGLRRLTPISRQFGFDRGKPIDRYYIEDFLGRFSGVPGYVDGDIRGRVLEVGDDVYTRHFGRPERVDVLHVSEANSEATVIGRLETGEGIPADQFDCVICTQTLHLLFDFRGAIESLHRMLKPGGVLLVTFPGLSQSCNPDRDLWGDHWRFTSRSARLLFEEHFQPEAVTVEAYGNVLTAVGFLHGLAAEEFDAAELRLRDPDYEVLIGVRAMKPERRR